MVVINPVDPPGFLGEHELTLDIKNRMLIPVEFRRKLDAQVHGDSFIAVYGDNKLPWLYAAKQYMQMVKQTPTDMMPDEDLMEFNRLKFGTAQEIPLDPQGRAVFKERTLKRSNIGREVTLVGMIDHLELWNRADWNEKIAQLLEKNKEVQKRAREARTAQAQAPSTHVSA